ncbi:MAG: HAD family hydrolase [Limnochordales bacterium]|nr:HAD family hydrolase [Limnochordales bacterium]
MRTLLLFDLDGTLLKSNGAGTRALNQAFKIYANIDDAIARVDWRGKPDTRIIAETLEVHGFEPSEKAIKEITKLYLQFIQEAVKKYPGELPPGIPALLEEARRRGNFLLALGTGNLEDGARAKLGVYDLNRFFPVGGFAEDGFDRAELIRRAALRSAAYYQAEMGGPPPDKVVVVGDTPLDIDAAQRNGYYSLAVATGTHTLDELSACHPTLLFPDLGQVEAVLAAINGLPSQKLAFPAST